MHSHELGQFIDLVQRVYEPLCLEHGFIEREYYRVGFNKLMTRIKFQYLLDWLSDNQYFKLETVVPPRKKAKLTFYCKSAPPSQIRLFYGGIVN